MEDFDLFTEEIEFTKPVYTNILNSFVKDVPATPNGPNYECCRKLQAEECLSMGKDVEGAFQLSEAAAASLRTLAVYREEQLKAEKMKNHKIISAIKPIQDIIDANPLSAKDSSLLDFLPDTTELINKLRKQEISNELPFYKQYLRFSADNNVDNFMRILRELPKEWTIVQLTAPYNPNENLKPLQEYRTEIESIYLSMYTNDYIDRCGSGPITVNVPANVTKGEEKPLFVELYSLLEDNYTTIDNAQHYNNKKLLQNYWSRREDIDLRMKSVINVMDKEWLGAWGCLLAGKIVDTALRDKVVNVVDDAITDWGFIKLTQKQRILLYNLVSTCHLYQSTQIKTCIRIILTEHGNLEDLRNNLDTSCTCPKDFVNPSELCLKCLSGSFQRLHGFGLVDGLRAFSQVVKVVKDWAWLKKVERYPVVLIVDELLDTFPWENLPVLYQHPVSRIESIHLLYYLYKIHEPRVRGGYFTAKADVGRYLINPEKNLDRMEKRMVSFVEYWCGQWSGQSGEPPPPDTFVTHLKEADIFLYCGHGDGCRFASGASNGAGVEGAVGTAAVAILSGCGSVRLQRLPGRANATAAHHHLHIAGSPVVVGMLWEVTDLEVDKVVTTLVSLYAPTTAAVPWPSVGKARWSQGKLDTKVEQKSQFVPEPNLLRAICRARSSTNFVMIASSVVARGLPVRILDS